MRGDVLVTVAVLVAFALVLALFWYLRPRAVEPEPQAAPEPVGEEREVPLPVDPQNMPSWKVYAPRSGASSRSCTCHPHRLLEPGQRVLWWPVPKSGGAVQVFCEEGVKLPEEERQK